MYYFDAYYQNYQRVFQNLQSHFLEKKICLKLSNWDELINNIFNSFEALFNWNGAPFRFVKRNAKKFLIIGQCQFEWPILTLISNRLRYLSIFPKRKIKFKELGSKNF